MAAPLKLQPYHSAKLEQVAPLLKLHILGHVKKGRVVAGQLGRPTLSVCSIVVAGMGEWVEVGRKPW